MQVAEEKDRERILQYIREDLQDCVYLYIDIMNYGIATENMKVWFQEKAETIRLVVMKYYDSFQVFSREDDFDVAAVTALLEEYPVAMVSGKKSMIEQLEKRCSDYEATYGAVFVMDRYRKVKTEVTVEEATDADAPEIASLICSDKEIGGHYTPDGLAAQLAERINTRTGRSYIIRDKGKIAAHSATYAEAEGIAVVGGTIIAEEYRNSDYYMVLSNYMLQQLEAEGKKAYTFSLSAKMIRYHGMLHTRCGEYGKLTKNNKG